MNWWSDEELLSLLDDVLALPNDGPEHQVVRQKAALVKLKAQREQIEFEAGLDAWYEKMKGGRHG